MDPFLVGTKKNQQNASQVKIKGVQEGQVIDVSELEPSIKRQKLDKNRELNVKSGEVKSQITSQNLSQEKSYKQNSSHAEGKNVFLVTNYQ